MPEEPQIIIVVEGGVIQAVHSNTPIEYKIIDFDDLEEYTEEEQEERFKHNYKQDSLFTDFVGEAKAIAKDGL